LNVIEFERKFDQAGKEEKSLKLMYFSTSPQKSESTKEQTLNSQIVRGVN
jgi:hypothetical protein